LQWGSSSDCHDSCHHCFPIGSFTINKPKKSDQLLSAFYDPLSIFIYFSNHKSCRAIAVIFILNDERNQESQPTYYNIQ
jgi:hypothetical protein